MSHKQHFLLSAKARTLSVRQVCEMSEEQAFELFKEYQKLLGEVGTHQSDYANYRVVP